MPSRPLAPLVFTLLAGLLMACGSTAGPQPTEVAPTSPPAVVNTAAPSDNSEPTPEAAPTDANTVQADVPMLDNPVDLKVTSNGTFIAYKAESTFEAATAFYQEQLEANGWERVNKNDTGFAENITLLRKKPDQNISVTIQLIAGSTQVRVQITLSPKS